MSTTKRKIPTVGQYYFFTRPSTDPRAETGDIVDHGKLIKVSHSLLDGEILAVDNTTYGVPLSHLYDDVNEARAHIK